MKISEELKAKIKDATVLALQSSAGADDVDDKVVSAVVAVLEQAPSLNVVDKVKVQYVGRREQYDDAIADTGTWIKGQVKLVSKSAAKLLFEHPSVYVEPTEDVEAEVAIQPESISDEKTKNTDTDEELSAIRDNIMAMTDEESIKQFVKSHFNREIPGTFKKIESMRQYAIQQIDIYGLP